MNRRAPTCGPATDRLTVSLGERAYDIVVGAGELANAGRHLRPLLKTPRVIIVTDETVAGLYLEPLRAALAAADIGHHVAVLPSGEATKDFAHLQSLAETILAAGIERSTAVVALGGGVVGDITGLAAGILLRGLDFVQIPTTLLAQVDSSVGGKTGINTPQGKNLVGLFHQPRLVIADTTTLDTLDDRQLRAGYAEVAKYGLLGDAGFFDWLERSGAAVLAGDPDARRHAVLTSCAAKARIVVADELEAGQRALLNLGHTFAHALEAETGFGERLLHGEAVAFGMVLAFDLSVRMRLCPPADAERARFHLADMGLPTRFSRIPGGPWNTEALMTHMQRDKKVNAGQITFVLVRRIGDAFIARGVDPADVAATLDAAIAA